MLMETVFFLLILVFFIVYLNHQADNKARMKRLNEKLDHLVRESELLKEELKTPGRPAAKPQQEKMQQPEEKPFFQPRVQPRPFTPEPLRPKPQPEPRIAEPVATASESGETSEQAGSTGSTGWFQGFIRNNPDLEKFIGENLVNKIGIAILVLGIAFFVKYAIDKNWINEVGRVAIGFFCGALLVGIAHYLRKNYRSFSSVLAGGGIAVFYFTITFAFHQYGLISQTAAFLLMVLITAFAITLSLFYDRLELALIATIGGFLTPFLVSTGQGDYVVLFTYLIILNSGLLSLSYFKRWVPVNIFSFLFTVVITAGWLALKSDVPGVSPAIALSLITVLYLVFLAMNMINQVHNKKAFSAFDFFMLLFLSGGYYAAGMTLLHADYQGLFTLGCGLIDLVLAWYFFSRKGTDRNLLSLLTGLTITFISLAIPVQLHGHAITLFWCAEFVLLYWMFLRSQMKIFRYSSVIVIVLSMGSLLLDWDNASKSAVQSSLLLLFTGLSGIVTNVVAIIAFSLYGYFAGRSGEGNFVTGVSNLLVRRVAWAIAFLLLYISCLAGVNLFFQKMDSYAVPSVYHRLVTMLLIFLSMLWLKRKTSWLAPGLSLALVAAGMFYYLLSTGMIFDLVYGITTGSYPVIHLFFHWMGSLFLMFLCISAVQLARKEKQAFSPSYPAMTWICSLWTVTVLSLEGLHIYTYAGWQMGATNAEDQYLKAILTILWALCSFALMWMGMKFRYRTLRIISLTIFFAALFKLFFFDLRNISEGGKIAAFILLGALLLTISFMYQKLKKMIIDDATV
jgi:uncharacterized membrane protein